MRMLPWRSSVICWREYATIHFDVYAVACCHWRYAGEQRGRYYATPCFYAQPQHEGALLLIIISAYAYEPLICLLPRRYFAATPLCRRSAFLCHAYAAIRRDVTLIFRAALCAANSGAARPERQRAVPHAAMFCRLPC